MPCPCCRPLPKLPEAVLHRGLAHLQAAEFLYETRLFPELAYTFKHALTHEVAYSGLLHGAAARAACPDRRDPGRAGGDRVAEQVERLAHHALRGEVWDKTLAYCRQAGRRPWRGRPTARPWDTSSRRFSALPHLPETARDMREQAIDSAARPALGAPVRLGDSAGACWRTLREAEALADGPRRPASAGTGLAAASHVHCCAGGSMTRLMRRRVSAPLNSPWPVGMSSGRRWQTAILGRAVSGQGDYRRAD